MPASEALWALRWLSRSSSGLLSRSESVTRCLATPWSRSMATEAPASTEYLTKEAPMADSTTSTTNQVIQPWNTPVWATTYSFPSMEPLRFVEYPRTHLLMPMRKDILHRAVVYEGDRTRQGTASTKWRDDVQGSGRKLHAQKGTGRARVGDKKSPIRVGGGVAHGPHPRDFSTDLPRKIYDKAWRIALSYRYRRGQLIIIDDEIAVPEDSTPHLLNQIFKVNGWGHNCGRSTLITERTDEDLIAKVNEVGEHGRVLPRWDVDVKDLLETGRLVIEKRALDRILAQHSRDLNNKPAKAQY